MHKVRPSGTMLYVDGDHLTLVHYCDAGNRPGWWGGPGDGKKVELTLPIFSAAMSKGIMYHAVFPTIDANHHIGTGPI